MADSRPRLRLWRNRLPLLAGFLCLFSACNQPPLIPAPPDTGPELEALQLSQGLLPPFRPSDDATAPARLEDRLDHYGCPGVSMAVIEGGELRWAKAWGIRRAGGEDTVTPDSLFQISSISKALTATVALELVDDKKLDLDADLTDRLRSWLGPPKVPFEGVTLRRLLSHTAGVNVQSLPGFEPGALLPDLDQVLLGEAPAQNEAVAVVRPPGTAWSYSGGGFALIEKLITEETGRRFEDVMADRLFDPLGMDRSSFEPDPADPDQAVGHDLKGRPMVGSAKRYPYGAAAGIWSTPQDVAQWIMDLQKAHAGKPGRRLNRSSVRTLLEPQPPGDWGLGIQVGGAGQARWWAHSGGNEGFPSLALGFVSSGHGVVIATNGAGGHGLIREILTALAFIYDWPAFQQHVYEETTPTPEQIQAWVGTYDVPALVGTALVIAAPTQEGSAAPTVSLFGSVDELTAGADGVWRSREQFWQLTPTAAGADGPIGEIRLSLFPGLELTAVRRPEG